MTWGKKIAALRPYVIAECRDIPPDFVMAIIKHESNGIPGRMSSANCACGKLSDVNGNEKKICNALGLMQTIPDTINGYNATADRLHFATIEDMTGSDDRAIRIQIAVGCWYIAAVARKLRRDHPGLIAADDFEHMDDDDLKLILLGYAMGAGGISRRLQQLADSGKSQTSANIKKYFASWGQSSGNRPFEYVDQTWSLYAANRHSSYGAGRAKDLAARAKNVLGSGSGMAVIVGLLGLSLLARSYIINKRRTIE
jgi:SLT domain-containing protein